MGANVEGDFEADAFIHTFAMSKDDNEVKRQNKLFTIKNVKDMKKMMIALVAMVVMTMSANAQSNDKNGVLNFERMSSYLELRIDQVEPARKAIAQFSQAVDSIYLLQDVPQIAKAWQNIDTRHKSVMKKILSEKQYNKYVVIFDQTIKNLAETFMEQKD